MDNNLQLRPPCAGLWNTPMVMVTGEVTTCCLDEHLANKIGSLRDQSLDSLWNGALMKSWRLAQVVHDFNGSGPLCGSCNWRSAGSASPLLVWAWLSKLEREDTSSPRTENKVLYSARTLFFGLRRWWNIQCAR